MRYVPMQVLTWGTIAGAIGSALLLAALDSPTPRYGLELPAAAPWSIPSEPMQSGRPRAKAGTAAVPSAGASAASPGRR